MKCFSYMLGLVMLLSSNLALGDDSVYGNANTELSPDETQNSQSGKAQLAGWGEVIDVGKQWIHAGLKGVDLALITTDQEKALKDSSQQLKEIKSGIAGAGIQHVDLSNYIVDKFLADADAKAIADADAKAIADADAKAIADADAKAKAKAIADVANINLDQEGSSSTQGVSNLTLEAFMKTSFKNGETKLTPIQIVENFNQLDKQCRQVIEDEYKTADTCCVAVDQISSCSTSSAGLDPDSMFEALGSAAGLAQGIIQKNVAMGLALSCRAMTQPMKIGQKVAEQVQKLCKAAKTKIEKGCQKSDYPQVTRDLWKLGPEIQNTAFKDSNGKKELWITALTKNKINNKRVVLAVDAVNNAAREIPQWADKLAAIEEKIKTDGKEIARLEKTATSCQTSLGSVAGAKATYDAMKAAQEKGVSLASIDLPTITTPEVVVGDDNSVVTADSSSPYDDGDDDDYYSNDAGEAENKDDNGGSDSGSQRVAYASPAGTGGGGGGGAGSAGKARTASVSGPSSLLKGFSNKSYNGRIGVGGQKYSSGSRTTSIITSGKKRRKGKAFNLRAFLPGGKNDPNRKLSSISGSGVDIFAMMSRKFKSSCQTKKLLDCK